MKLREAALSAAVLATVGCGPGYKVVRQATPNPMTSQATFSIQKMDLRGSIEDPEAAQKLISCFEEEISSEGGPVGISPSAGAPFVVRPNLTSLSRSQLVVKETVDAELTVTIVNAAGQEVDVFTASASRSKGFSSIAAAVKDSAPCQVGTVLARAVVTYVHERTGR